MFAAHCEYTCPLPSKETCPLRVDILNFDDCPNVAPTVELVKRVAARLGVSIDLHLIHVASHEDAVRERFLGSPTVRVNGIDVDPSALERSDFGLSCRVYGPEGIPSEQMIASALTRPSKKHAR